MLFRSLALLILVFSLGLRRTEWQGMGSGAWDAAQTSARNVARGMTGLATFGRQALPAPANAAPGPLLRPEPRLSAGRPEPKLRAERGDRAERAPRIAIEPRIKEEEPARVKQHAPALKTGKRAKAEAEPALDLGDGDGFQLPPLSLLQAAPSASQRPTFNKLALEQNARLLETVLGEFGVHGTIAEVNPGPVVTRYDLDPQPEIGRAHV